MQIVLSHVKSTKSIPTQILKNKTIKYAYTNTKQTFSNRYPLNVAGVKKKKERKAYKARTF